MAVKNHDTRPIPQWLRAAMPKWLTPHWIWIYVEIAGDDECWEWTGSSRVEGYGRFRYNDRNSLAHRVAYCVQNKLTLQELDKSKLLVRHKCDNPACCNPRHLETGTHLLNMRDRNERGRYVCRRGEDASNTILNEAQVLAIRERAAAGLQRGDINMMAAEYGVDGRTISAVIHNKSWRWLKPDAAKSVTVVQ